MEKLCTSMRARGHNETVIEMVQESAYSFALYGFPEAHSISFALIAYASTWLKAHRPAEFVASLLNNQPMGFYSPATLVQDARRHGVKFRPVCVARSAARCTIEADGAVRLGLDYVKGVRAAAITAMLAARAERPFASLEDWLGRTTFTASERRALASVGALHALASHRRAALWQVEAAWESEETLFKAVADLGEAVPGSATPATVGDGEPLAPMTLSERYHADFAGVSLTTGAHPMTMIREQLPGAWRATDLPLGRNGDRVQVAGSVICRQRPGTAKGFVFVSLEDETGIANAVVTPQLFEKHRLVLTQSHALAITGRLQNQDGVIHIKAERFEPLAPVELPEATSHDFH
jgi:error-prone DNA polymerase